MGENGRSLGVCQSVVAFVSVKVRYTKGVPQIGGVFVCVRVVYASRGVRTKNLVSFQARIARLHTYTHTHTCKNAPTHIHTHQHTHIRAHAQVGEGKKKSGLAGVRGWERAHDCSDLMLLAVQAV